ncbi:MULTISPECIES: hypothetical protein [unclassified Bradyrhizobium]|uniref:hypothetical protein n=1 Tax=unclassified Bradyrhizobium TaxID=2631580 RepID=UPI001FF9262F|nr:MULTISPECIES: hypothetical protein [unclassified Bradyrhizobium]MCK1424593.1 hypothetical protein [Bradyrhizobium sp. CW12]MCK1646456.1 hypothetical protein [Bradyrhizobium sp. 154]
MTADRTDRMKALSKLALGIVSRCGERFCIDRADGRWRLSDVRHNEFRLTLSRPIDDGERTSALDIRFDGKTVLHVEWTTERVLRMSYRPGAWEALLLRYDRAPVLAGYQER